MSASKSKAANSQVVMINEAHHVPQTRVLTIELLKPLYDLGYRYLAAETFQESDIQGMNLRKYPTQESGFYTTEPVFGRMVREAKKIGFTLVAYEHTYPCDHGKTPAKCQDLRERGQATNIIERVLKKDPKAKIIVHAGYGHIDEVGGSTSFPWTPMAKYFRTESGIDPLTIDQIELRERGNKLVENQGYEKILNAFSIESPTVLVKKDSNEPYVIEPLKNHYDIQVVLPRTRLKNSRPNWLWRLPNSKAVKIENKCLKRKWCLIQVINTNEIRTKYVPVDRFITKKMQPFALVTSGNYIVKYFNQQGVLEAKHPLDVRK